MSHEESLDIEDEIKLVHKNERMMVGPLVIGEFTRLYMLSTWKEPETLTPKITVTTDFPSGFESGGFFAQKALSKMTLVVVVV